MTGRQLAHRYALLTGLRWFPIGLVLPVLILVKEARGLDVATIGQVMAVYGITTVVLELPTGGLADVIGRRGVVVLSSLTTAAGLLVLALATNVPTMCVAMVLQGAGRALSSGPLTAWYVDAVHADDVHGDIQYGLSRGEASEAFGLGIGAVVGGFLPAAAMWMFDELASSGDDPLITLSVPLIAGAVLSVFHAVLTLLLVQEPERPRQTLRSVTRGIPATVADGLRLGTRDVVLRRLMLQMMAIGVVLSSVELLTPLTLADLTGGNDSGSAAFGVLAATGFIGTTVGSLLAPRAARAAGSGVRVVMVAFFVAAPFAALLAVPLFGVVAAAYVLMYAVMGLVGPLTAELLHGRVGPSVRSTVLSVESLALQAGGLTASIAVGALAQAAGIAWGYAVVAAALVVCGVLMIRLPSTEQHLGDRQRGVGRQVEV